MISVSADNYFAILRAAQLQAARTGMSANEKQSVPVAIEKQAPPPAPQNTKASVNQIIDVLV